jgi:hypothetical protein
MTITTPKTILEVMHVYVKAGSFELFVNWIARKASRASAGLAGNRGEAR